MRRTLSIALLLFSLHIGFHFMVEREVRQTVSRVVEDYNRLIYKFREVVNSNNGLSEGAFGLSWGSTPAMVYEMLGQSDSEQWSGAYFQVSYRSKSLFLQFFSAERRENSAKLFSIRSYSGSHFITDNVKVGQHYMAISRSFDGRTSDGPGHRTIYVRQDIRLICVPNKVGECEQISVINQGVKR
jgi:hypothetical protein